MSASPMERFWDARAREDALYFVDSRVAYGNADEEAFWAGGEDALDQLLGTLETGVPTQGVVVDVGCGVGRLTRPLAAQAERVVGIDVSREMLERARALNGHLDNVEWLHGDGRTLRPIPDASVDLCVSHVVFRHIPDQTITLGYVAEIGRVLRPGGLAAIELSNDAAPHTPGRTTLASRLSGLVGRGPRGGEHRAWLGSSVGLGALRETAERAGLDVEAVVGEGTEFCAVRLRRRADAAQRSSPGVAGYYDHYWAADEPPRYEPDPELLALLETSVERGDRVLDLGCGAANGYAPTLGLRAGSYVGVDVSAHAVDLARAGGFDARLIEDASRLPFEDGSFDAVVCVEVLEHLFAPYDAATEARRVLRPGGRLIASVPNAVYWRLRLNALRGMWNPLGDELSLEQPWRDPHIRFFTPSTLERMLLLAGFARVEVGAHGGRFLDHLTARPTSFGQGRLYRRAAARRPALLGMTLHAVAER